MLRSALRSLSPRSTAAVIFATTTACSIGIINDTTTTTTTAKTTTVVSSSKSRSTTATFGSIQYRRLFNAPLSNSDSIDHVDNDTDSSIVRCGGNGGHVAAHCPKNKGDERQRSLLDDGIIIIPNIISTSECNFLKREADDILDHREGGYNRDRYDDDDDDDDDDDLSLRRVSLVDMSIEAQTLSNAIIQKRVLPYLKQHMPSLLEELNLDTFDHATMTTSSSATPGDLTKQVTSTLAASPRFEWAADEPSINRYTVGGCFDRHKDGYPLTVIVLIGEESSFVGGGTRFFENVSRGLRTNAMSNATVDPDRRRETNAEDDERQMTTTTTTTTTTTSILVQPRQGDAVLFGGDMPHAGEAVREGTRHLFVASFGIVVD